MIPHSTAGILLKCAGVYCRRSVVVVHCTTFKGSISGEDAIGYDRGAVEINHSAAGRIKVSVDSLVAGKNAIGYGGGGGVVTHTRTRSVNPVVCKGTVRYRWRRI